MVAATGQLCDVTGQGSEDAGDDLDSQALDTLTQLLNR
jgi:hypothetical protein